MIIADQQTLNEIFERVVTLKSAAGLINTGSSQALMMLLWNLAGSGAILAWNVVCGAAIFGLLKAIKLFRVDEADEITGLDIIKHNEPAYPRPVYPKGKDKYLV